MPDRITIHCWSVKPLTDWMPRLCCEELQSELTDYLELKSTNTKSTLRLTPGSGDIEADDWVELVATINRHKNRSVLEVDFGELSGYRVEFATTDEWIRGWALSCGCHSLDATYRCAVHLAGREDSDVERMLNSIRLERL